MNEVMRRPFYAEYAWAFDLLIDGPIRKECAVIAAWLIERGVPPGAEILDAGCGTGRSRRNTMKLSAIFESWHVEDGNYPPLSKGQLVNLSFQCQPRRLEHAEEGSFPRIDHLDNAECQFCARVLRVYAGSDPIAVLDTGSLRFYINGSEISAFQPGSLVRGEGTILLVSRILQVRIPERFVTRHDRGKNYPTHVSAAEFEPEHVVELETMAGQPFDEEFYILEFDDTGLDGERVARTFRTFQLHLFLLGVGQAFAGRGVAQRLVAECLAQGGRKGYEQDIAASLSKARVH